LEEAREFCKKLPHSCGLEMFDELVKLGIYHPPTDDVKDGQGTDTEDSSRVTTKSSRTDSVDEHNPKTRGNFDPTRGYFYAPAESVFHHYSEIEDFPERLWITGDAYTAFNPIYGQGMTMSLRYADLFNTTLKGRTMSANSDEDWILDRLQGALDNVRFWMDAEIFVAWTLTSTEDLKWADTTHNISSAWQYFYHSTSSYLKMQMHAAEIDPDILVKFHRIQNMIDPLYMSFAPSMLFPVIYHWLFSKSPSHGAKDKEERQPLLS